MTKFVQEINGALFKFHVLASLHQTMIIMKPGFIKHTQDIEEDNSIV